ncbi:MAG TPA: hypothetical protein VN112_20925 [Ensifer sp.]|nr:hypothetical protein [Ensifer sp.]
MTSKDEVGPVSGSDDARAGGEGAEAQRAGAAEDAERNLLQDRSRQHELETRSHELAMAYLRLGGHRRAVMDDNKTDTRKWEPDEPAAEEFWQTHIAPLSEAERKQVEQHLPSVNID